jgi:hypothetical protein
MGPVWLRPVSDLSYALLRRQAERVVMNYMTTLELFYTFVLTTDDLRSVFPFTPFPYPGA